MILRFVYTQHADDLQKKWMWFEENLLMWPNLGEAQETASIKDKLAQRKRTLNHNNSMRELWEDERSKESAKVKRWEKRSPKMFRLFYSLIIVVLTMSQRWIAKPWKLRDAVMLRKCIAYEQWQKICGNELYHFSQNVLYSYSYYGKHPICLLFVLLQLSSNCGLCKKRRLLSAWGSGNLGTIFSSGMSQNRKDHLELSSSVWKNSR